MPAALLIQLAVKTSILLTAAWAVTRAMKPCSAATRHLVWAIAILATLVLPLVALLAPRWDLPVLPAEAPWGFVEKSTAISGLETLPTSDRVGAAPKANWQGLLIGLWMAGLVFGLLRLATGVAWAMWIVRHAERLSDPEWLTMFEDATAALQLSAHVSMRKSGRTTVPVACGIWMPTVLLPLDADRWPAQRRRAVLLHELAHVKRCDCLVQAIAQLACALHWFNPLAQLAVMRLRAEQERACDDLVLATGMDGPQYADHLFEIVRASRAEAFPGWVTLAMSRSSKLEGRVRAILDNQRSRRPPARRVRFLATLMAFATVLPLGGLRLVAVSGPAASQAPAGRSVSREPTMSAPANAPTVHQAVRDDVRELRSRDPESAVVPVLPAYSLPPIGLDAVASGIDLNTDVNVETDSDFYFDVNLESIVRENLGLKGTKTKGSEAKSRSGRNTDQDERRRRDPSKVPDLLKALHDPDTDVRERAVKALARHRTPEAAEALLEALQDQSSDVRERAAEALGRHRNPTHVDALAAAARDEDPEVREEAVAALGRFGTVQATQSLMVALQDEDVEVRHRAARALGRLAASAQGFDGGSTELKSRSRRRARR